jgi:hypothetical protein
MISLLYRAAIRGCLLPSVLCLLGCKANQLAFEHATLPIQTPQQVFPGQLPNPSMVLIDKQLVSLSGRRGPALNCGWVEIDQSPDSASDCALSAYAHKSPFYVRYNLQGIDSQVSAGLAGDAEGKVYFVEYDSMGWETDGIAKEAKVTDGNHIYTEPCPSPISLKKTRTGRLTCAKSDPNAAHNIMSPNFGPY